ncbi:MAG: HD domain-containing protein [bacterium]|nr:HD domain-containing protein [bacterium]
MALNKLKNFNDPVYGFVSIPCDLIYDIIAHPNFQRLRRIKQLGLSNYVYPGAQHTRFQHVIGAMSLTQDALATLRQKGIEISTQEEEAVLAAIILHDIGHGPFSHTLENVLIKNLQHEEISLHLMHNMNADLGGRLDLCIQIFTDQYARKFLHQLVSSQLDMDRLDYLRRDSFYSGVQEGVVGQDRIIKMLNVANDELVVDEKGIYSIEKFLIARRLMYWQVYLHKTVVAAESVLVKTLERAFELIARGEKLFAAPALAYFLDNRLDGKQFFADPKAIENYTLIDDDDVMSAIKVWCFHSDVVLSSLATILKDRLLPKVELKNEPFGLNQIAELKQRVALEKGISLAEADYFVFTDSVKNRAYSLDNFNIKILFKDGSLKDITKASDQYNIEALTKSVTKYFLCYPKSFTFRP